MSTKKTALIDMEEDTKVVPKNKVASLVVLVKNQLSIEAHIGKLQLSMDALNDELKALTEKTIPAFFDEVGVKSLTLPDGTLVAVEEKVYPNIKAENWPKASAWLIKKGFGSLIKTEVKVKFGKGEEESAKELTAYLKEHDIEDFTAKSAVNPQTLGAFVREQLAAGKDLPLTIDINPVRKSSIKTPKTK